MTKEPALEGLEELLSCEPLDGRGAAVLLRDALVEVTNPIRKVVASVSIFHAESVVKARVRLPTPRLTLEVAVRTF